MDFGTIKNKLFELKYGRFQEFLDDIDLVFKNCNLFNDPTLPVIAMCNQLEVKFKDLCEKNDI